MQVPYFDLKQQYAGIKDEVLTAIDRVCQNASFILGDEVTAFEKEFAEYCGAKHCVALNTGTSALHLALLGIGINPGDEIITTSNTFFATAEAISYCEAKPVFVDVDPATGNIDPAKVEAAITPKTRAILPVHLYGRPADLDALLDIGKRKNLEVIEDACQAHGARYRGKRCGSIGRAAAFSFYPGKNLGAYGEGGALTTNDDAIAAKARQLRDHGQAKRYEHDVVGFNYRMDGFQGAVLRIKLRRLDEWTKKRRALADVYRKHLAGSKVRIPHDDARDESCYHLFVVWADDRDRVKNALQEKGVGTALHYPIPVHLQKPYAHLGYKEGSLPHTERAAKTVFSLPLFPELSLEQAEYAAKTLAEVVGRA
jgi:dTDP-4-amino-4,6-dideoxygalactose transaminase